MKRKKTGFYLLTALMVVTMFSGVTAFASNDDIEYSFYIQPNQGISVDENGPRYRQTSSRDNEWKVRMTITGEGYDTITQFRINRNSDQIPASDWISVKHGAGYYYDQPYSVANQTNVRLAGRNNNVNASTYVVCGQWDEEIW